MGSEVIVVPIIFFTTGAVLIAYYYLRYRERSTIIERGLSTEQMMALYNKKRDPLIMLKIGVVVFFFGLGLGGGLLIQEMTGVEEWVPFLIFTMTGLGFIVAFFVSKKYQE
ncbi:MAG: hypothetical protein QY331_12095 [Melioribacteraceae bacterium]|jgi:hypothetical protein|nr:hypothetical protein [Melioribacteraceae bacterium]RJP59014.1 MAG: hypothetical protein C4543_07390 [Ignavibacteriales bacterium]WKZ68691.1 MAG: hypothetical protein QY331_12095 [Melioribacteraceae bacterium]